MKLNRKSDSTWRVPIFGSNELLLQRHIAPKTFAHLPRNIWNISTRQLPIVLSKLLTWNLRANPIICFTDH